MNIENSETVETLLSFINKKDEFKKDSSFAADVVTNATLIFQEIMI